MSDEALEVVYEIRIAGEPLEAWSAWFPSIGARVEGDETLIHVPGADASLLHGVLAQIGSLNLRLISLRRIERRLL